MNHPRLRPPARRRLATPRASSSASGWFADRLGYSNADASRIAARIQPHFRERLEWHGADATCQRVQNELGLNDRELRSIVTRWPLLVGLSFDDVVLPSLAALRALVGDELDLKSVVLGWPAALFECDWICAVYARITGCCRRPLRKTRTSNVHIC